MEDPFWTWPMSLLAWTDWTLVFPTTWVAIHKHFVIIIFGGKRQQKAHNKLGPGLFDVEGWTKRVGGELCGAEELFGAGKDWFNISIFKTSNQTISIIMGWDGNTENVKNFPRRLKFSISELRRGPRSCHCQAKAHKHAPGLGLRNQNRNGNKILW